MPLLMRQTEVSLWLLLVLLLKKEVINLTVRKPKGQFRKKNAVGFKKKKKGDGNAKVVEIDARVGTHSEHFLKFVSNVLDTLDQHGMKSRYQAMDNAGYSYIVASLVAIFKSYCVVLAKSQRNYKERLLETR